MLLMEKRTKWTLWGYACLAFSVVAVAAEPHDCVGNEDCVDMDDVASDYDDFASLQMQKFQTKKLLESDNITVQQSSSFNASRQESSQNLSSYLHRFLQLPFGIHMYNFSSDIMSFFARTDKQVNASSPSSSTSMSTLPVIALDGRNSAITMGHRIQFYTQHIGQVAKAIWTSRSSTPTFSIIVFLSLLVIGCAVTARRPRAAKARDAALIKQYRNIGSRDSPFSRNLLSAYGEEATLSSHARLGRRSNFPLVSNASVSAPSVMNLCSHLVLPMPEPRLEIPIMEMRRAENASVFFVSGPLGNNFLRVCFEDTADGGQELGISSVAAPFDLVATIAAPPRLTEAPKELYIHGPDGKHFGTILAEDGSYGVYHISDASPLVVIRGDLSELRFTVASGNDRRPLASAARKLSTVGDAENLEVHMQSGADVALVVSSILGIVVLM